MPRHSNCGGAFRVVAVSNLGRASSVGGTDYLRKRGLSVPFVDGSVCTSGRRARPYGAALTAVRADSVGPEGADCAEPVDVDAACGGVGAATGPDGSTGPCGAGAGTGGTT